MSAKVSLPLPNIANNIALHVGSRFPALWIEPPAGVWFTGSNIWSFVVGMDPRPDADWDIFVFDDIHAEILIHRLGLSAFPASKTKDKHNYDARSVSPSNIPRSLNANGERWTGGPSYGDGLCYFTDCGEIDVWISSADTAIGELKTYPDVSHAHCRAAFSFTEGLVMMPNSMLKVAP